VITYVHGSHAGILTSCLYMKIHKHTDPNTYIQCIVHQHYRHSQYKTYGKTNAIVSDVFKLLLPLPAIPNSKTHGTNGY